MQDYRRELSVDVDDDAGPAIVIHHRQRAARMSVLEPTSNAGVPHDQMIRLRKLMALLNDITPVPKTDNMLKAKAFLMWAEKLPLYQKCDELAKQLQERSQTLTIIKESYLRDVISVKSYLKDCYKATGKDDGDLKELSGLPSIDIRPVLAVASTCDSSNHLQDTMLGAGLASDEEKAQWKKNPWENKAYKRYKELMGKGSVMSLPTEVTTISMYAPSKHRLLVRYCRQCIGVMSLVAEWNGDVQEAFKTRVDAKSNEELRKVIRNLNEFIFEQADKYDKLNSEFELLKKGNKWFDTWKETSSFNTDMELKANRFRDLYVRWSNEAGMCAEDKDGVERKLHKREAEIEELKQLHEAQSEEMNQKLSEANSTHAEEKRRLERELKEKDLVIEQKDLKMEKLQMQTDKAMEERARFERVNGQLIATSDEKDRILSDYREEAVLHIESLTTQVHQLGTDIEKLEQENERLSNKVEELQAELEKVPEPEAAVAALEIGEKVFDDGPSVTQGSMTTQEKETRNVMTVERIKAVMSVLPPAMRRAVAVNIKRYAPVRITGDQSRIDHASSSMRRDDSSDSESGYNSRDDEDSVDTFSDGGDDETDEDYGKDNDGVTYNAEEKTEQHSDSLSVKTSKTANVTTSAPEKASTLKVEKKMSSLKSIQSLQSFDVIEEAEDEEENSPPPTPKPSPLQKPQTTAASATDPPARPPSKEGEKVSLIPSSDAWGEETPAKCPPLVEGSHPPDNVKAKPKSRKSTIKKMTSDGSNRKSIRAQRRSKLVPMKKNDSSDQNESKPPKSSKSVVRKASSSERRDELSSLLSENSLDKPLSVDSSTSLNDMLSDIIDGDSQVKHHDQGRRKAYVIPTGVVRVRQAIMKKLSSLELPVDTGGLEIAREKGQVEIEKEREYPSMDKIDKHEASSKMLFEYQEGVSEMLEYLAPYIKPPLSLKVVATCVRFCVRFKRAIEKDDMSLLGAFGQKVIIKRQESNNIKVLEQVTSLTKKIEETHDSRRVINQANKEFNSKVRRIEEEKLALEKEKVAMEQVIKSLRIDIIRQHIIAQWQRSVANELVSLITVMRLRLHILLNAKKDEHTDRKQLASIEVAPGAGVPRSRVLYLVGQLRAAWMDVLDWTREHTHQRPMKKLKMGKFDSFDAFGSRIRNEVRDLKFFRGHCFKDIYRFERLWNMKVEKMEKVTTRLQNVIQSKQCPTCIEYEQEYMSKNSGAGGGKMKFGQSKVASLLNVLKPKELQELKDTMKESMKEHLREEFVQEEEQKIAANYKANVSKFLEKEYALHDEINALNSKLLEVQMRGSNHEEERERLNGEVGELTMKLNDLSRQNLVLRTAVKDSYRVSQSEGEELQRSKEIIANMIAAASNKSGVDKGTQLYEDHMSLSGDEDSEDGILMAGVAGQFLRKATIMGVDGHCRVARGGGALEENPDMTWLRARDMDPDGASNRRQSPPKQRPAPIYASDGQMVDTQHQRKSTKFHQIRNFPGGNETRRVAFESDDGPTYSVNDVPLINKQKATLMAAYLQKGTTYSTTTGASTSAMIPRHHVRSRPFSATATSSAANKTDKVSMNSKADESGRKQESSSREKRKNRRFRPESAPLVKFA